MFFVWVFGCVFALKPGFKLVWLNFEVGHFVCFLGGFFVGVAA
ncbi:hypothetical protein HMPREF0573_11513 [Mobiluncus curtisii ATCC 43063]|uniref:Uncharacterized protein n=1 Tax=Mobiluncus curtisii (strain ATCC 43063 / DSM 2711 / V125) TaxID=548479 RepID=D6ZGS4_MOBCV|nr:hypothetical protein HMPREF0573_11513 [Mobiluncus curtisii ATCC 43063]